MATSKILPGFFFVLFVSFLGLVVGTFIGGVFFVPPGSGLAGPAIALGYGLVGLVVALVGGVVLARRLAPASLRKALLIAGMLVLLAVAFLTYRFVTNRSGSSPASEAAVTVWRQGRVASSQ